MLHVAPILYTLGDMCALAADFAISLGNDLKGIRAEYCLFFLAFYQAADMLLAYRFRLKAHVDSYETLKYTVHRKLRRNEIPGCSYLGRRVCQKAS